MSVASKSNSQTTFVDATSRIDINITSPSGSDTPIPTTNRLSANTLANLMEARMKLENLPTNSGKRKRSNSPGATTSRRTDERDQYPPEAKPVNLKLKTGQLSPDLGQQISQLPQYLIVTQRQYKCINLPKRITCELSNIIHLITCSKCKMCYVGETSREFRKRIYEHRNSVLNPKLSRCTPVSRHFTQQNHKTSHMEFSVLVCGTPKFGFNETGLRRRHELSWIFKLHWLAPLGINQHV